jgi:hypothetical protein
MRLFCLVLAALACLAPAQEIKVLVDDSAVEFKGAKPVIRNRRVHVPLRGVMEKLGAEVIFDADRLRITARKNNMSVELWVGSRHATVNGEEMLFDTEMAIVNGRVYVPLRFLAETLDGSSVGWRPESRTVVIRTAKKRTPGGA